MRTRFSAAACLLACAVLAAPEAEAGASGAPFGRAGAWAVAVAPGNGACEARAETGGLVQRYTLGAAWTAELTLSGDAGAGGTVETLAGCALPGATAEAASLSGAPALRVALGGAGALRLALLDGGVAVIDAGGARRGAPAPDGRLLLGMLMDCGEFIGG
ncbi:hypothetical protein ACQ5SO_19335 [Rhodovulum sp. DZ06]|uniref:hypothetical protein n=1 Tax=Rhodovulum sp. DZ06 TaxID=3425126 RepID=UPI003D34DC80